MFHWACLDAHARRLPATTAPAGYTCPFSNCSQLLFPAPNLVSPVADVLREKLAGVNWARAGLGLPLVCGYFLLPFFTCSFIILTVLLLWLQLSEDREIKPPSEGRKLVTDVGGPNGGQITQPNHSNNISSGINNNSRTSDRAPSPHSVVDVEDPVSTFSYPVSGKITTKSLMCSTYNVNAINIFIHFLLFSGQAPRRVFEALDDSRDTLFDHDDNKYKRRSAYDLLKRWWK